MKDRQRFDIFFLLFSSFFVTSMWLRVYEVTNILQRYLIGKIYSF